MSNSEDIEGIALLNLDGELLRISPTVRGIADWELAAVQCALLISSAVRFTQIIPCGNFDGVYLKGTKGFVIGFLLDEDTVLVGLCRETSKLGLIYLDLARLIKGDDQSDDPLYPEPIFPRKPPDQDNARTTLDDSLLDEELR
jgi:predicted regulator of Ras-like GTPase activity (Roadblock/LC7/MglB family)